MAARYHTMEELLTMFPNNKTILDAAIKTEDHINRIAKTGGKIKVSVSGGSDSDIMLDMFERLGYDDGEVIYVWYDTGLEYDATKRHLKYLEQKYGIEIKRFRSKTTVAQAVKKYGVPFLSKRCSAMIDEAQRHGFVFKDTAYEEIVSECGGVVSFAKWYIGDVPTNIKKHYKLKEFMIKNKPPRISHKCCEYAKKRIAKMAQKVLNTQLSCVGMRRSEGGTRTLSINSCFSEGTKYDVAKFRPIFYFTDEDKQQYKEFFGLRYSDCYEVWGFKRTGCAGCPFNSNFEEDLKIIEQYEPKVYKTAVHIFGESYEYTRKYRVFKEEMKKRERIGIYECQESLFET